MLWQFSWKILTWENARAVIQSLLAPNDEYFPA
jgi:hypothetical protein